MALHSRGLLSVLRTTISPLTPILARSPRLNFAFIPRPGGEPQPFVRFRTPHARVPTRAWPAFFVTLWVMFDGS
jgi:hypothetical protein